VKLAELAKHLDEVQDWTWDAESYIKFAMNPLEKAIKEMLSDDPRKDALLALLNFGNEKIHEMTDRIQTDVGTLKIRTSGGDSGCVLGEKVIGAYIEPTDNPIPVNAQETPQKRLFIERRRYKREG